MRMYFNRYFSSKSRHSLRKPAAAVLVVVFALGLFPLCAPSSMLLNVAAESYDFGEEDFYAIIYSFNSSPLNYLTDSDSAAVFNNSQNVTSNDEVNRLWRLKKQSDGSYMIFAGKENKALTVSGGSTATGTAVVLQDPAANSNAQKWDIEYDEDYVYMTLSAKCTNCVLDCSGTSPVMNTRNTASESQQFSVLTEYFATGATFPIKENVTAVPGTSTEATTVKWEGDSTATYYNVYILKNGSVFKAVYDTRGDHADSGLMCKFMLPTGDYTAKVESVNGRLYDCATMSDPTDVFTVTAGSTTVPSKSTLSCTPGTSSTNTVFNWTAGNDAHSYDLYIETLDESNRRVSTEKIPSQTGLTYSKALPAGKYRAWVNAVNQTGTSWSESDPVTFTVTDAVTPPPVDTDNDLPDDFFGFISSIPGYTDNQHNKSVFNDNGAVVLKDYTGTPEMIWHFTKQDDGNYSINSGKNGRALTVKDGSASSGADVVLQAADGSDSQVWNITGTEGVYRLSAKCTVCTLDADGSDILMSTNDNSDEYQTFFICTHLVPSVVPSKAVLSCTPGTPDTDTTFTWTDSGVSTTFYVVHIDTLDENNEVTDRFSSAVIYSDDDRSYAKELSAGKYRAYIESVNNTVYGAAVMGDPVVFDVSEKIPDANEDGTRTYTFVCSFTGSGENGKTPLNVSVRKGSSNTVVTAPYSSEKNGAEVKIDLQDGEEYTLVFSKPGHTSYSMKVLSGTDGDPGRITLYPGDITEDGMINAKDQADMTDVFGAKSSETKYKPSADFNEDGTINAADRSEIVKNFGKTDIDLSSANGD